MLLSRIKGKHLFLLILILGIFLRFYRLPQTMQFLGDQGRDALIVRRMLIEQHPALIGPVTSVGNMYLGPFYYYFMLFPLMLTYPDPTGPALAVAVVGVITLWLIYKLGKQMVGVRAAIFACILFAISPLVLTFSRFSWNPNIVPLFSLLFFWHTFQALKGKDKAWIFVGLWFAILIQLHYITLILLGVAGIVWLGKLIEQIKAKKVRRDFIISTLLAVFIFLASLIPLVVFDVRHDYINSKAFSSFFSGDQKHFSVATSVTGRLVTNLTIFVRNFTGIFSFQLTSWKKLLGFLVILVPSMVLFFKQRTHSAGERFLFLSFVFCVFGLSFYSSTLYDHYLVFMFPVVVIILGIILSSIWELKWLRPIVLLVLVGAAVLSYLHYPGKQQLGYNIFMMKRAAGEIVKRIPQDEKYNIFLFSPSGDVQGMNYRYFLVTGSNPPLSETEFFGFSRLYAIQDIPEEKLPSSSHYMFAVWPNRDVVEQFDVVDGPRVFVLKR